jgi:hypothetical protein
MPNGDAMPNNGKKVDKFDALKQWLKIWQLYPAILVVAMAGGWAASMDASMGSNEKQIQEIKDDAKIIKDDLRWRHQKDDERWENLVKQISDIHQMLSDQRTPK